MLSYLDLLPTDRTNEFEVVLAGDHMGYVWFDGLTWVATEDRDIWGVDGHESARDAAEYLIGY